MCSIALSLVVQDLDANMMEQLHENPVARAALFGACYVAVSGALMLANGYVAGSREVPWTWYWFLWTVLFAPAVIATTFAAVWTAPGLARLGLLYGISLLAILVVMETLWLIDARMATVIICVVSLCVLVFPLFRFFDGAQGREK
jgi:hypothetical protein